MKLLIEVEVPNSVPSVPDALSAVLDAVVRAIAATGLPPTGTQQTVRTAGARASYREARLIERVRA